MENPEQQSPTTIEYHSGTNKGLGRGWDVMTVVSRGKDRADSVVIARDASGTIVRRTDYNQWEVVSDEETLRVCRGRFDHRDRLAVGKAVGAGRKVEEE
jgi:hypothetical protein